MQKNSSKNPQTDKTNIVVPVKILSYHNILQDIKWSFIENEAF